MAHNRKLVLGVIALTQAKIRGDMPVLKEIRDEIEKLIIESNFLEGAPFRWVGLILRYGLKNATLPECEKPNDKEGDLPVAIEVDTAQLVGADREILRHHLETATLKALIAVGRKYHLKISALEGKQRMLES